MELNDAAFSARLPVTVQFTLKVMLIAWLLLSQTRKRLIILYTYTFFLEDLFGRAVDLITVESLSPYIGSHILDEVEYVSVGS
uniref:hypothetical protein n=1 Tax=Oculatella sp. LEGE 06141 TaxID=1828648 RepID=UPI002103E940|nr:hypothetical protein [Oculatella sp. LEGE 06141]